MFVAKIKNLIPRVTSLIFICSASLTLVSIFCIYSALCQQTGSLKSIISRQIPQDGLEPRVKRSISDLWTNLHEKSSRSLGSLTSLLQTIPITKIVLTSGTLVASLLILLRIIVVLGPILILGTLAREDTDIRDLIRQLIDNYKMIIETLDNGDQAMST